MADEEQGLLRSGFSGEVIRPGDDLKGIDVDPGSRIARAGGGGQTRG